MTRACFALLWIAAPAAANDLDRLQGAWTIVSVIDHGQSLTDETIRHELARDARIVITADALSHVSPASGALRKSTIRLEIGGPQTGINLIDSEGVITRGILRFDGNRVVAAFSAPGGPRPTEFVSRPGDDRMIITLEPLATGQPQELTVTAASPPTPQPTAAPAPSVDEQWQRFLVGGWRITDNDGTVQATFNADGTFGATREWRRPARRMFVGNVRMSGRWRVVSGSIIVTITAASADRADRLNQTLSYRITSATPAEVILVTQDGQVVRARRG